MSGLGLVGHSSLLRVIHYQHSVVDVITNLYYSQLLSSRGYSCPLIPPHEPPSACRRPWPTCFGRSPQPRCRSAGSRISPRRCGRRHGRSVGGRSRCRPPPRLLARRLTEIAPQALGFSKPRWNNIRSLLRAALELVTKTATGRHLGPRAPAWQLLWEQLPTQTLRTRLSRLLHYCSAAGVEPGDVDEATFADFREHLDTSLLKRPAHVFRGMVLGWNAARVLVRGWPDIAVTIPSRWIAWTLPWSAFPESLQQDVSRYLDRLAGSRPGRLRCKPCSW